MVVGAISRQIQRCARQDIELMLRLRQVGEMCEIAVLDHVVVGAAGTSVWRSAGAIGPRSHAGPNKMAPFALERVAYQTVNSSGWQTYSVSYRRGREGGGGMVKFADEGNDGGATDVTDLYDLYYSLDRKGSHVDPRPPQTEALNELTKRRQCRDLVLKMSTGYGKTTVALVYLWSHMVESGRPVVYLCPTTQLVDQVLREAENLGIMATYYRGGQKQPDAAGTSGKAIIVCTYDKLFNAHSTFNRTDVDIVPFAVVLDDSHSGIQEVRDAFNIHISLGKHADLFRLLGNLLRGPCKNHQPGIWEGIERQDDDAVIEVPFWIWAPLLDQVRPLLEQRYQDEDGNSDLDKAVYFKWPFFRNHLRWCRCIVSGSAIEIVADPPTIQEARQFYKAERRLFMSATLSDDSALVREFGCDPEAAKTPVVPPSDQGVGERMILAPSLIDPKLDRKWVMQTCANFSSKYRVVVLTASEKAAKEWTSVNAIVAMGSDVAPAVEKLKAGTLSFVAFPQRYDGVDLPDDSCRILVLDGIPTGQGLADDYDRKIEGRTGGAYRRWIYRVEQGMGRAVRSQADYAVVIVTGPDLVNFLAKKDVVAQMGETTRIQLKASERLTAIAKSDTRPPSTVVGETMSQSLFRDPEWKKFYDKNVKQQIGKLATPPDEQQIALAAAEQQAQKAVIANDPRKAAQIITDVINSQKPIDAQTGWLLQRKANYVLDFDPGDALKIQSAAYMYNDQMSTPPAGVTVSKAKVGVTPGSVVLAWYNTFDHPNGAIAELAELKTRLSFGVKPAIIEQALMDVGQFFGTIASRPEKLYRRGPDDLWEWGAFSWVIEAKSERGMLPKVDSGQLHDAMEWYKENYPERTAYPIIVAAPIEAEDDAHFPAGTRVLTPAGLEKLVKTLEMFVGALVQKVPVLWTPEEVAQLLIKYGLSADQFAGNYTVPLAK